MMGTQSIVVTRAVRRKGMTRATAGVRKKSAVYAYEDINRLRKTINDTGVQHIDSAGSPRSLLQSYKYICTTAVKDMYLGFSLASRREALLSTRRPSSRSDWKERPIQDRRRG